MSFWLSVSGHADQETQDALAAKVGTVLRDAGEAVSSASWSGNGFSGDPRDLAADSAG
jgi:hypothetical protein